MPCIGTRAWPLSPCIYLAHDPFLYSLCARIKCDLYWTFLLGKMTEIDPCRLVKMKVELFLISFEIRDYATIPIN